MLSKNPGGNYSGNVHVSNDLSAVNNFHGNNGELPSAIQQQQQADTADAGLGDDGGDQATEAEREINQVHDGLRNDHIDYSKGENSRARACARRLASGTGAFGSKRAEALR